VKLKETEMLFMKTKEKLKEAQTTQMETSVEDQIVKLEDEVKANQYLEQHLPREIEERRQWSDRLRQVLNQPALSDLELNQMDSKIQTLKVEVQKLTMKKESVSADDKLQMYRQQYNSVEKKKSTKEAQLKDLLQEQHELTSDLKIKQEKLEEMDPTKVLFFFFF
jgi:hypothetical protein